MATKVMLTSAVRAGLCLAALAVARGAPLSDAEVDLLPPHIGVVPDEPPKLEQEGAAGGRAWGALLYGDSINNTMLMAMQIRSTRLLTPLYPHVTMVTDDVPPAHRKVLEDAGTQLLDIGTHAPLPSALENSPALQADGGNLLRVWRGIFSKLRIWQWTQYEQVVFLDGDALMNVGANASSIFDACGAYAFGAARDAVRLTPRGAPMLNAGMMAVRPSEKMYALLMEMLEVYEFELSCGETLPEQTFLSDVYRAMLSGEHGLRLLDPTYNYGCHGDPTTADIVDPESACRAAALLERGPVARVPPPCIPASLQ
jgi:hypothetical protein